VTTALRAESRKLFTTQVWLWLVLLALGLTLLFSSLFSAFIPETETTAPIELILNFAVGFATIIAAVLGVIGVTGEFRHLTATPTFLSVPKRGTVIASKLVLYLVTGLAIGVICMAAAVTLGLIWLKARGFDVDLGAESTVRIIVGGIIAAGIYGVLGVGVGALLRNQVAAVVGIVIYLFLIENILSSIPKVRAAYPYLPGGAASSLTQTSDPNAAVTGYTLLDPWVGGLLLLAYGLVFAVVGARLTVRRDIS
jgi:ABC-2 type transport system permease protein